MLDRQADVIGGLVGEHIDKFAEGAVKAVRDHGREVRAALERTEKALEESRRAQRTTTAKALMAVAGILAGVSVLAFAASTALAVAAMP